MRRCNTDSCIGRINNNPVVDIHLPIAKILDNPSADWNRIAKGSSRLAFKHEINVDWTRFNIQDYLLTHASIVVSCQTEENNYYIKPACSKLINNNGNSWSNEVLLATFKTFIGAFNFREHVQDPRHSKGIILDAVLRPFKFTDPDTNETADVYLVDILVATERKHHELVGKIASGELTTLSMGCTVKYVTCSKCGKVFGDNDKVCEHIEKELLQYFVDENGIKRRVSEMCGRVLKGSDGTPYGDPDSVRFIEASWVEKPAYKGAVINHYISDVNEFQNLDSGIVKKNLMYASSGAFDYLENLRVDDVDMQMAIRVAKSIKNKAKFENRYELMVERIAKKLK